MAIELKKIGFSHAHGRTVFKELDFSFYEGQRLGLYGANGSGKSTLLHLIMGLIHPQAGEIEIFGTARKVEKDFHEVRRKIGLLFQDTDDQLFCPTVAEDIAFGPLNCGKTHEEAHLIVTGTCEALGLNGYEHRVTHHLSGGEKRLVALATVIAMKPDILLLDEPTAGIDNPTVKRIIAYLNSSSPSHLIISHDLGFLESTTDGMVRLVDGRIEAFSP